MQPVRIIDAEFNLLAEIDDYESLIWTRRWHKPGEFELHINAGKQNVGELQKGRLLLAGDKAGIILHRELRQGDTEQIMVRGASLASVVGRRITVPPAGYAYDRVNANAETIMKGYVERNCVNPADSNRTISNLAMAADQARGDKIVYQTRYKQLDEELEKLSLVSGLGWDVRLDWLAQGWVFDVLQGRDLTAGQTANPPVIFSADFDAVERQAFIESDIGHRNLAYVGGQGEGVEREIVEVGDVYTGLDRLETFVDARDIENSADLPERGVQKLAEVSRVLTFDTEILTKGPYRYGEDWDLGDIVTVQNRRWGVTLDSRIIEVTEVYEPGGFRLSATFGSSIPTLPEKIKQELDRPLVEKSDPGEGEQGEPGEPGQDGVGLDYDWQGTQLGIKREDESQYNYADLKGPKGDTGAKGDPGQKGDKPNHRWISQTQIQFENPDGTWGDAVSLDPEAVLIHQEFFETTEGHVHPVDTSRAAASHTHPKSQITDFAHSHAIGDLPVAASGTSSTTQVVRADDSRLSNARTPTSHTHTKSQITDMPTKLSQFTNDIGAGAGLNIVASPTEPAQLVAGDWWYKEI